jgi:hypothetical protein
MPNWCVNSLTVEGSENNMKKFYKFYKVPQCFIVEIKPSDTIQFTKQYGIISHLEEIWIKIASYLNDKDYLLFSTCCKFLMMLRKNDDVKNKFYKTIINNKYLIEAFPSPIGSERGTEKPFNKNKKSNGMCMFDQEITILTPVKFRILYDSKWTPLDKLFNTICNKFKNLNVSLAYTEAYSYGAGIYNGYKNIKKHENIEVDVDWGSEEDYEVDEYFEPKPRGKYLEFMIAHGIKSIGG